MGDDVGESEEVEDPEGQEEGGKMFRRHGRGDNGYEDVGKNVGGEEKDLLGERGSLDLSLAGELQERSIVGWGGRHAAGEDEPGERYQRAEGKPKMSNMWPRFGLVDQFQSIS
jgi:hypothetical protein